ncbi:MAG: hypothetical protein AABX05_01755 [Nanoarchaeota archaeon]
MPLSPLRKFSRSSIDELIDEDVSMRYYRDSVAIKNKKRLGLWNLNRTLIYINPTIVQQLGKYAEDVTIVHEWLHAYEDLLLDPLQIFREKQIDWWAYFHLRQDALIADYIRSFFHKQGF